MFMLMNIRKFLKYGLINVLLITPQTSVERINFIDSVSNGFIYMVSSASVTGSQSGFGGTQETYFKRIADMNLKVHKSSVLGSITKKRSIKRHKPKELS
jgi:tryptophan synthase alpha subunit